jgi:hypothetical protein
LHTLDCRLNLQPIRANPAPTDGVTVWHEDKKIARYEGCQTCRPQGSPRDQHDGQSPPCERQSPKAEELEEQESAQVEHATTSQGPGDSKGRQRSKASSAQAQGNIHRPGTGRTIRFDTASGQRTRNGPGPFRGGQTSRTCGHRRRQYPPWKSRRRGSAGPKEAPQKASPSQAAPPDPSHTAGR